MRSQVQPLFLRLRYMQKGDRPWVPGGKLLPGRDRCLVQLSGRQEFARYTIPATGEGVTGEKLPGTNATLGLLNPDPGLSL